MPLRPARNPKDTVSYRPNSHRTENVTVLAAAPAVPTGLVATPSTTGGTLAAGTYIYRVTSMRNGQESAPTAQVSAITTGATGSVSLAWNAVPGATSYRVYGRSGTIQLMSSPTSPAFVDTAAITPSGALPTAIGRTSLRIPYGPNVTNIEVGNDVGDYRNRYGSPGI